MTDQRVLLQIEQLRKDRDHDRKLIQKLTARVERLEVLHKLYKDLRDMVHNKMQAVFERIVREGLEIDIDRRNEDLATIEALKGGE